MINYDMPRDADSYIHRIGRTGLLFIHLFLVFICVCLFVFVCLG